MLSTMLVLTAIMGVVNFSNYREMLDRADEMTALLEQNDGKFPEEPSRHEQDDTETPPWFLLTLVSLLSKRSASSFFICALQRKGRICSVN